MGYLDHKKTRRLIWVYTGGIYYCWGRGESYSPGAIFLRGEIVGGLTEIE